MSKPSVRTNFEVVSQEPLPEEFPSKSSTEESANSGDIAALAYRLWEERGCPDGDPEQDWYEAEHQVTIRKASRQER
jgi:hypothetical protein